MVGHPIANSIQYVLLENEKRLKSRILFYLFISLLLLSVNIAAASPPVLQVQDKSINESQLLTFVVSATDPDGDKIVYAITGLPQGASFTDGSGENAGKKIFSWTPGYDSAGTYPVSFSATDGTSTVYANITITVVNVNREPVLAVIGPKSASENSQLAFALSATDPDNNTAFKFSLSNNPKSATIDSASGVFQWTPTYDEAGTYQVEFIVSDGNDQDSEYVTITVNNANRPPVFSPIADTSVNENEPLEIILTASDHDKDVLVFTKNVPFGTISGNKFSWKPTYDNAGEHSIQFTVSDGDAEVTQTAKVTVSNVNRAPILYSIPDVSARVNEQITLQLAGYDADGDVLTYHNVSALPAGAQFNTATGLFKWTSPTGDYKKIEFNVNDSYQNSGSKEVIIAVGSTASVPRMALILDKKVYENETLSFTITATNEGEGSLIYFGDYPKSANLDSAKGLFTWTPSYDDAGKHIVEFGVYDSKSRLTDYKKTTIEVINSNRPPQINEVPAKFLDETQTLQTVLTATDPDGDSLTFKTNKPSGTIRGNTFIWTPGYFDAGDHYVEFIVSDGALTASTIGTIVVYGTNMPPKFNSIGTKEVTIGDTLEFTVSASDGDGTPLVYSASGMPSGANFNATSRVFKWTPAASQKGTYSVSFRVSDGTLNDYQTIAVTAKEPSPASSSGGGSGGGGSSSGSGEKYENVAFKDYSIRYVMKDTETAYNFTKGNSTITQVSLTSRLNQGQTKVVVETLKDRSSLVNKAAPGLVYRNLNVWVGDDKFSPASLSDAHVTFRVEKGWVETARVDPFSIRLLRHTSGSWEQLPTTRTGEDEIYIYYIAKTPGFSMFAISSMDEKALMEVSGIEGQGSLQPGDEENSTMSLADPDKLGPAAAEQERRSSWLMLLTIVGLMALGVMGYRYKDNLGKAITQFGNPDGKRYRRFRR